MNAQGFAECAGGVSARLKKQYTGWTVQYGARPRDEGGLKSSLHSTRKNWHLFLICTKSTVWASSPKTWVNA